MEVEILADGTPVKLSGELNIYTAAVLKDELFPAVRSRGGEALIDLSGVTELDTAGVQVLLLIRRLAIACGARFALLNPSAAAFETLELCGLGSLLAPAIDQEKNR